MGYSPLDGLVMGTRTGCIDGMAVLRLAEDHGIEAAGTILNKESGLKGLAGTNDMATLLSRDDEDARFAVEHFCYWAARQAGSAIAAMRGVDAVAFTGGIGENAETIRDRIMAHLKWLGRSRCTWCPPTRNGRLRAMWSGCCPAERMRISAFPAEHFGKANEPREAVAGRCELA